MAATANLTWDPAVGATSYKVEYKLSADSTWTLFNAAVTITSASIPGLNEGSNYDFRVTTNCSTGNSSGVVTSGTTPCNDISGFGVTFVGTTANLQWAKKPHAVSYTIEYKLQSSGTYLTASGSPLLNAGQPDPVVFAIAGLGAGMAYDFRVKVNCIVGTSTGSVVSATSSCLNSDNLAVTFS